MSETKYLIRNSPEVMMFNLQWASEPSSENILKILVSIPEHFELEEVFTYK